MAFSYIQGNTHENLSTSSSTVAVTLASTVGSGHALMVWVGWASNSGDTVTGISDDKSNTYTLVDLARDNAEGYSWQSAYLLNATNAPKTITATLSASQPFASIVVDEYSGIASSAALNGHAMQDQLDPGIGANAVTSGNITTTAGGDLIYGGTVSITSSTLTAGTSFAQRQFVDSSFETEDRTQASAGSVAATFTTNGSGSVYNFITGVMAFKAAASGITVTVALPIPLESATTLREKNSVPLEALASLTYAARTADESLSSVTARGDVPDEGLAALNVDLRAPSEFLTAVRVDDTVPGEALAAVRPAASVPGEFLAGMRVSVPAPGESLAAARNAGLVPNEFSGVVAVTAIAALPLEFLLSRRQQGVVPVESRSAVVRTGGIPLESLAASRRAGIVPGEWSGILSSSGRVPSEFGGGIAVTATGMVPLEFLATVRPTLPVPSETLSTAMRRSPIPIEALAARLFSARLSFEGRGGVIAGGPVPLEFRGPLIVTAAGIVPIEFGSAVAVTALSVVPLEFAGNTQLTLSYFITTPQFLVDLAPVLRPGEVLDSISVQAVSGFPLTPILFLYVGLTNSPTSGLRQALSGEAFAPSFNQSVGTVVAGTSFGRKVTLNLATTRGNLRFFLGTA